MTKRSFQVLVALLVCLALTGTAYAAQGKSGKGKAKAADTEVKEKGKKTSSDEVTRTKGPKTQAAKKEHARTSSTAGPDNRPPGWDQGGKKGWGDCDVPPGLAKKRGCNSTGYSTRERAEVRRQAEVKKRAASSSRTTTTTTKTTTTTMTTDSKKKDGTFLGTLKDAKQKADSKTKPVQQ